jgi:hypothetical protein
MASTTTTAPGASSATSLIRLSDSSLRTVAIPYHTVPIENLAALTSRKLEESGVPLDAQGRLVGSRVTLIGCVQLTPFARATVPPALISP